MHLTHDHNDSVLRCAVLVWRTARSKCSQSESARILLTLYCAQVKKEDEMLSSTFRGALEKLQQQNEENNPAHGDGSQQQVAPKSFSYAGRHKQNLFQVVEDDERATP